MGQKIDFILNNYSDIYHILVYPLISSVVFLTVIPFLSNGAYWLSLKFNKWRVDQKNMIDKKQLLSLEQSISIREEIAKQEDRFGKLVESKNLEIRQLQFQLNEFKEKMSNSESILSKESLENNEQYLKEISERIKSNKRENYQFEKALELIQSGYPMADRSDIDSKFIALLESYDLIENKGNGKYQFTNTGKKFQKLMLV